MTSPFVHEHSRDWLATQLVQSQQQIVIAY